MGSHRRAWVGPPLATLAVIGGLAAGGPGVAGARPASWEPSACADGSVGADRSGGWFVLEPEIDADGWLTGQTLELGQGGVTVTSAELDAESFASGPTGGLVVAGTDDGRRSFVRVVDTATGCTRYAGEGRDVVRSAVLVDGGTALLEHRVDRRTRADLGVWRVALDDGDGTPVLSAPPPDDRYGRTFATILVTNPGDPAFGVVSCGEDRCRARVVAGDGTVSALEDIGEPIGLAGDALVAYRPCHGWPCGIERIGRDGQRTELVDAAGAAVLVDSDGPVLVFEAPEINGRDVRAIDVRTLARRPLGPVPGDLNVRPAALRAAAAAEAPPGLVVLDRDGARRDPAGTVLLELATGRLRGLEEADR